MGHLDRRDREFGAGNPPSPVARDGGERPAMADHGRDDVPMVEGPEKYLAHLAHLDMPLAMKIELIAALQAIMQSFVDRAFGDDPVQQIGRQRATLAGTSDTEDAGGTPPVVDLAPATPMETDDNDLTGAFRDHAGRPAKRK